MRSGSVALATCTVRLGQWPRYAAKKAISAKLKGIVDSGYGSDAKKNEKATAKSCRRSGMREREQKHGTPKEAESNQRGLKSKQI
jgi:hypothetical protein